MTADKTRTARTLPPRLVQASGLLIALQAACATFFAWDVTSDIVVYIGGDIPVPVSVSLMAELTASAALVVAILIEVRVLIWFIRRQALMEHDLELAGAAVEEVVINQFEHWRLTGAEQDVALFVVKGLSIAEIAVLRGSSEATVKSHLNAIYRKSGSAGRSDMLATILDVLMGHPGGDAPSS
ncbi:MAG: helix-turn-helix transcriptional regulator [Rhodobacter sp.]|nr:helix-turn-helix transcriptional regulator [Paracoccaceae bacterium]MCC0076724.1 helix-turn-helix transcriptional regulator [Rhodobacter sp.]